MDGTNDWQNQGGGAPVPNPTDQGSDAPQQPGGPIGPNPAGPVGGGEPTQTPGTPPPAPGGDTGAPEPTTPPVGGGVDQGTQDYNTGQGDQTGGV